MVGNMSAADTQVDNVPPQIYSQMKKTIKTGEEVR